MKKLIAGASLAAMTLAVPAFAQDLMKVNFVQSHPAFVIGEEIFIYVVPKLMGYYAEQGLDVTIENAQTGTQGMQMMLSGRAQFATGGVDGALALREQGGDPVAFATIKQNNGWLMGVKPDNTIKTWPDVAGKTIGLIATSASLVGIVGIQLEAEGLKEEDFTPVAVGIGASASSALDNGTVDGIVYYDSLFTAMENNGLEMRYLEMPATAVLHGQIISTTDKFRTEHPEAVLGMCRSIAMGRHFALTSPEAAVALFYQEWPAALPADKPLDVAITEGAKALAFYMKYSEEGIAYGEPTGWITPEKVARSQVQSVTIGMAQGSADPTSSYTNEYFEECNNFDHAAVEADAKNYKY